MTTEIPDSDQKNLENPISHLENKDGSSWKDFLKKEKTQAILLSLGLILLAIIIQYASLHFMRNASENVLIPINKADSIQNRIINSSVGDSTIELITFKNQYQISQQVKSYYTEIARSYYMNYYSFSICAILCSTLLTIVVFLISNKGWQRSSLILRSVFLTLVLLSSIFYFLPKVLDNKENYQSNAEKVLKYQALQSDMLSFANVITHIEKNKIDSALTSNYARISSNLDFFDKIDDSQLNINSPKKELENISHSQK